MECIKCGGFCIKRGRVKNTQRYRCKRCRKNQQASYAKMPIPIEIYNKIHQLNNEGIGIRSMGRYFEISKSSIQRVLKRLSNTLPKPIFNEIGQSYKIDEVRTFCGNKQNEIWLIYAINRRTKQVIDFMVGKHSKENIQKVLDSVLQLKPECIYSDKLNIYKSLIKAEIHKIYPRCTNYIERKNLTLRTQLKPLNRKTIGFTRSEEMLYIKFCLWAWR